MFIRGMFDRVATPLIMPLITKSLLMVRAAHREVRPPIPVSHGSLGGQGSCRAVLLYKLIMIWLRTAIATEGSAHVGQTLPTIVQNHV